MKQNTHSDGKIVFAPLPKVLSPDAVYDLLMQEIEPELMSSVVDTLKDKYKNETRAQARERAERYAAAFEEYDRRLDAYIKNLNDAMNTYVRQASASLEVVDRTIDNTALENIESSINDA